MLSKRKKSTAIKDVQIHTKDTGSPEVQTSILSKQIDELASHLKKHPKDHHSRRGLLGMVASRHSALKFLQKNHPKRYESITKKLGLKQK